MTITYRYRRTVTYRYIYAYHDSVEVGHLQWLFSPRDERHGSITSLYVYPAWRRKGIATQMLKHARTHHPVTHSLFRTADGEAWALSTGDPLPNNQFDLERA